MASRVVHSLQKCRKKFTLPVKVNWYPGHMAKGVKQMQQKLRSVDCIIEVHDARIPFSGRNPNFYHQLTAIRPHILVLNKMDMANLRHKDKIVAELKAKMNDTSIIFTDCKKDIGITAIMPAAIELIKLSDRFNRAENLFYNVMIIGVPNVGKSSLINSLRSKYLNKTNDATRVGPQPGVTQSVLEKIRICDDPVMYLLDTPGVLQPNIRDIETGMKLALCAVVAASNVGEALVADYLLYWMNKHQNFNYVEFFKLKEPTDDIDELLLHIAAIENRYTERLSDEGVYRLHPDFEAASKVFIDAFQNGKLGKFMLDIDYVKSINKQKI